MTYQKPDDGADVGGEAVRYGTPYHVPVLWQPMVTYLITNKSGVYVDATAGGGGMTKAILDKLSMHGHVIAVDRDKEALDEISRRLASEIGKRLTLVHGSFGNLAALLEDRCSLPVNGLLMDLGLSSRQIDDPDRGFSFDAEGPLDMRMDRDLEANAGQLVNSLTQDELRRILRTYGDEPKAGRIAKAIVRSRPVGSTRELADVVRRMVPYGKAAGTLARVFQAIRIAVNDEMSELEKALKAAEAIVTPGGRLAVLSYQSGEDRRVKRMMRFGNLEGRAERDIYGNTSSPWLELTSKPMRPSEEEMQQNPRSRSARLRVAERRALQNRKAPWA